MKKLLSVLSVGTCWLVLSTSPAVFAGEDGEPGDMCGAECFGAARAAQAQCSEDGGSFFDCMRAFGDALMACREENGCEGGVERPEICGLECFAEGREAVSSCREDGGSFWDCIGAFRDAVSSCREDLGCEVHERPEPCGIECFPVGRDAFRACREAEGSLMDCVQAFLSAVGTCREEAGCEDADEEEEEKEDQVVQALIAESVEFTRGDANDDRSVDISDAVSVLSFLFLGESAPTCLDAADANDDGVVDVSDPTMLLNSLFLGGGPLPAPGIEMGIDPTEDSLDCVAF